MTKMYEWLLVLSVLVAGAHRFGVVGLFNEKRRGRHCAIGRSKMRVHGTHRRKDSHYSVRDILASTKEHMLPSMYYHELPPSRRGLAHAA